MQAVLDIWSENLVKIFQATSKTYGALFYLTEKPYCSWHQSKIKFVQLKGDQCGNHHIVFFIDKKGAVILYFLS
ncbi:MAG: hypothetical protein A3F17_01035 [Gammaproteobacteria bacterium RIFCSPHIGHO2_12_FULL_41_15]|nr:MAG: hypothetical protein A3F17_01035 [Gammaproteobacteria bacterium RIFCSPHIGHO2_12_FULL_41_15]